MDFDIPLDQREKVKVKERKNMNKYQDLARELKSCWTDGDTSCSWCTWNDHLEAGKESGSTRDQRKNGDPLE